MNPQYLKLAIPIFVIGMTMASFIATYSVNAFAQMSPSNATAANQTAMAANQTAAAANQTAAMSNSTK